MILFWDKLDFVVIAVNFLFFIVCFGFVFPTTLHLEYKTVHVCLSNPVLWP